MRYSTRHYGKHILALNHNSPTQVGWQPEDRHHDWGSYVDINLRCIRDAEVILCVITQTLKLGDLGPTSHCTHMRIKGSLDNDMQCI